MNCGETNGKEIYYYFSYEGSKLLQWIESNA